MRQIFLSGSMVRIDVAGLHRKLDEALNIVAEIQRPIPEMDEYHTKLLKDFRTGRESLLLDLAGEIFTRLTGHQVISTASPEEIEAARLSDLAQERAIEERRKRQQQMNDEDADAARWSYEDNDDRPSGPPPSYVTATQDLKAFRDKILNLPASEPLKIPHENVVAVSPETLKRIREYAEDLKDSEPHLHAHVKAMLPLENPEPTPEQAHMDAYDYLHYTDNDDS